MENLPCSTSRSLSGFSSQPLGLILPGRSIPDPSALRNLLLVTRGRGSPAPTTRWPPMESWGPSPHVVGGRLVWPLPSHDQSRTGSIALGAGTPCMTPGPWCQRAQTGALVEGSYGRDVGCPSLWLLALPSREAAFRDSFPTSHKESEGAASPRLMGC